jgi:AcrR family transcriptional regulator/DNA-binding PadR family transcriptional regulator
MASATSVVAPGVRSARRDGARRVFGSQRGRLLEAAFTVVAEEGYRGLTVRRVAERAGVSSRTFYEQFGDCEECFLAAFDHAVAELAAVASPAYESELEWVEGVRGGLAALLGVLDREPAVRRLLFVESLAAGPRVLARRTEVLDQLAVVVDGGRAGMADPENLPGLVGEGVVGAVFGVIHARVAQRRLEPLIELLGVLMATIVLPYRGSAVAARELARPVPVFPVDAVGSEGLFARPVGSALPVDFRLTVRTQMILAVVAGHVGVNNREVSELAGIAGKGQVSRLMGRLQSEGLVENARGETKGLEKAWRLTSYGEAVLDAHRGGRASTQQARGGIPGGKLSVGTSFRMSVRAYLVLVAIEGSCAEGSDPSNVEVSRAAGIRDQGQISRMLRRLEAQGLLQNSGGATAGAANAWRLTLRGEALLHSSSPLGGRMP